MAESSQYLRLVLEGADYLLPSVASVGIEQRDSLVEEHGTGSVIAWRQTRTGRWPAYGLNGSFKPVRPSFWQRAVFLESPGTPVGLVADDVSLLTRGEMRVTPFAPLGPPPTRFGHLFNAAWIDGPRVTLVIDPRSLAGLLRSLGGAA